jgi:hypothetical protein
VRREAASDRLQLPEIREGPLQPRFWREALRHGPFALNFVHIVEAKVEGVAEVVEFLAIGGAARLNHFAPADRWLVGPRGKPDERG